MKTLTFLYVMISFCWFGFAQENIISLHPVVGDTINIKEKKDFLLFPDIPDSGFSYAVIKNKQGDYYVCSYYNTEYKEKQIDTTTMDQYYINVEKLSAYYSNQKSEDKGLESMNIKRLDPVDKRITTGDIIISPETRKKIGYESARYRGLNNSANDMGITGQEKKDYINSGGYYEIKLNKN